MKYLFFYDETEHSREINYKTINSNNYYDNFITGIIGWKETDKEEIEKKYLNFEKKYENRKNSDGELKSQTMNNSDFKYGFASLNINKISFYEDLISLYDEKVINYFSISSKMEFVISQLLENYNRLEVNTNLMKYSLIKAINMYKPKKVISAIYNSPETFLSELRLFLQDRIIKNQSNIDLKARENSSYEELLYALDSAEQLKTLDWTYFTAFEGFKKLLDEMGINGYDLKIDQEGKSITLNSAKLVGLKNATEEDSKKYVGIRMADMFVGIISKFMKSFHREISIDYTNGIHKNLLGKKWFLVNDRQFQLYKQLYKIICENNDYWYKSYAGIYVDDMVMLVTFLRFMNKFKNADEIKQRNVEELQEQFNAYACARLDEHFKLIAFQNSDLNLYSLSELPMHNGTNGYEVLYIDFLQETTPVIGVIENHKKVDYILPQVYHRWAIDMVRMQNMQSDFFPARVVFRLENGEYDAQILK